MMKCPKQSACMLKPNNTELQSLFVPFFSPKNRHSDFNVGYIDKQARDQNNCKTPFIYREFNTGSIMSNEAIILAGVALVASTCGGGKNGDYPGIKDSDTQLDYLHIQ